MDGFFVFLFLIGVFFSRLEAEEAIDPPGESSPGDDTVDACEAAHHTALHDARRNSGFASLHLEPTQLLDDHALPEAWYRFAETPGTRMPTKCVPMGMCGTRYPVWMSGRLPSEQGSAVVDGCINTEEDGCCNERVQMVVRNCGAYYIYHLPSLPRCLRPTAYCSERGPWLMVFKAIKGITNPDPYELWISDDALNENIPEASVVGTGYQDHFKSALVKEWTSLHIAEVRLSLYEEGVEVLRVIFEGSGIDKTSWFNVERIISSPYQDLNTSKADLFDIRIEHMNHRFMMSRSALDCRNANGWVSVIASAGSCDWDSEGPFPVFKYSRGSSATIWDSGQVGEADELAIFMRTEEAPVCREKIFQVISNSGRGVYAPVSSTQDPLDDSTLTPGWYRFSSPAGEEVTHVCQQVGSCGTRFPIWLMDVPSTEAGETVKGTMCINTELPGCCNEKIQVLVRNCGGFLIYHLPQLETQFAAYCTSFDEWDLVFKAVSLPDRDLGNLYDLWASDQSLNADVRQARVMDSSFPGHYKSYLISDWNRVSVQQVRLSLFKSGREVRRFIFDGKGSDRFNWFAKDRIVETPYTDMTASSNYTDFTLGSGDSRHFFINSYDGEDEFCSEAVGWLAVIRDEHDCLPHRNARPSFIYSGRDTSVQWAEGPVEYADVLAIFLKSPRLLNPCSAKNHVILTDTRRATDIVHFSGWSLDDRALTPGWYRFTDVKGAPLNMPTSCVNVHQCGTHSPIWIDDELPQRPGERKPLNGCINTGEDGCCNRRMYLGALNCGDYIVYGLDQVPSLGGDDEPAAFCTESDRWQLVYRLTDGYLAGPDLEQLWRQDSSVNTDVPRARQLDSDYPGNYKTYHVARWSDLPIEKVKLVIYKDGVERVILIFDGENTDSLSWFSKEKLLFSPWTDLNGPNEYNIFSLEGQYTPAVFGIRRWIIHKVFSPCNVKSQGWLMIVTDSGFLCALNHPPQIVFSNTTSAESWATGSVEKGDFMAIFLSFKSSSESRTSCYPWK